MAFVVERHGSREFDKGAGGGQGQLLFTVLGAGSEDEAVELAEAEEIVEEEINGYLLNRTAVVDLGGENYNVDFIYQRGVPSPADLTAGETPANARPSPSGQNPNESLGRDVSVTMGGATQHIYQSRETRYKVGKAGDEPPDFFGMIGFNMKTKEFMGCEVFSGTSDFTLSRRMYQVTIGYFRHALDLVACLNPSPWLGCDSEEVLFMGLDLQYKDGDPIPWSAAGRFKYSRNRANVPVDTPDVNLAEIIIPEVRGHDYVWVMFRTVEEIYSIEGKDVPVMVERPWFAYCERVYALATEITPNASFDDLMLR